MMIDLQPLAGPALVVGGGAVAARKVRGLVAAGFACTVIAPSIESDVRLSGATLIEREFEAGDLADGAAYALVFASTNSRAVNAQVGELARQLRIPVVVADSQAESTFFTPAVFRDGDLAIAVSTGGASPALARSIRETVVEAIGSGWRAALITAREERERRIARRKAEPRDD